MTGSVLAKILTDHAEEDWIRNYANRISQLNMVPLSGFLKGFIDLVFCLGDMLFLVDYKSNFLGSRLIDYKRDHLIEAMQVHHYGLQYHIYTLALHRFLQQRLRDYSYDVHFGGVFYLFIRGMSPENAGQSGVFFDRPSQPLIEAFSNACHREEP